MDYIPIGMRTTSLGCTLKVLTSLPQLKRCNLKLYACLLQLKKKATSLLQLRRCSLTIYTSPPQLKRCTLTMQMSLLQMVKYFLQCIAQLIRCNQVVIHLHYIFQLGATISCKKYIPLDVVDQDYIP